MLNERPLEPSPTSTPETPKLPQLQSKEKRFKTANFNPLAIKKMGYNFEIPEVIKQVRAKFNEPWKLGVMIGMMLYFISPLIVTHLDNGINFQNEYTAYLRLTDGCFEKFPDRNEVGRKGRRSQRRHRERYTFLVEAAFKNHIREVLADVFGGWSLDQKRLFNKGIEKGITMIQWVVYPDKNVVFEAGEGDRGVWLRGQCEGLGMVEAKAGRKVLEEM
ncbi:hypothetical protein FB567DRAFT_563695 [Paraphoma chrysanthemicola]|uniref:Uncharacterized protein n=1 Tax=Paraphoma chrysanthemicola TaxID=798071 RepID=A0A8K0VUZ6_9PLEO|nr:hypothetical protein FB567DRAFT_563695 [Paraphoma chrysanthemicola]